MTYGILAKVVVEFQQLLDFSLPAVLHKLAYDCIVVVFISEEGGRKVGHGGKKVEDNEVAVIATIVPLATTVFLLIAMGAIFVVTRLRGKQDVQAK